MKIRVLGIVACVVAISLLAVGLSAQTPSKFKNIQVLKGLSDPEINKTMQLWSKQLGVKCVECHVQGNFSDDEKEAKKTARNMYQMVELMNQQPFFKSNGRKADCYLCHRGAEHIPVEP